MTGCKTKIVCTIGPASASAGVLERMIKAGMNVARLNFSHGDHRGHRRAVEAIRSLSEKLKTPVAIIQDLQGPKIRTGTFPGGEVILKPSQRLIVTGRDGNGGDGIVPVSYRKIAEVMSEGSRILMDDGAIELEVLSRSGPDLECKVVIGGILRDRRGVNLPGVRTDLPALTRKDREDLDMGIEMDVDYIALSFVRRQKDVLDLKRLLRKKRRNLPVIAKIEKPQALEDIEGILEVSDGLMIARGDLGVELKAEKVPMVQKKLIRLANRSKKQVITATQMLESMTRNPRPTRAEASDVANAILDGTDAVMLSAETSIGRYPVESVRMMSRIAVETEKDLGVGVLPGFSSVKSASSFPDAVGLAACGAARDLGLAAIVVFTQSGFTAGLISKQRPLVPILAFTPHPRVQQRLSLYWGVTAKITPYLESTDSMIAAVQEMILTEGLAAKGDEVAIVGRIPIPGRGRTNMMKLHVLGGGGQ